MKLPSTLGSSLRPSRLPKVLPTHSAVAEVAPLRRLPRTVHCFDYAQSSTTAAAPGDLVSIPFHGGATLGVVIRIKNKTEVSVPLKPIERVVTQEFINDKQLALATQVAEHCGVSLGTVLMLCAPLLPNKNFKPLPLPKPHTTPVAMSQAQVTVLQVESVSERSTAVRTLIQRVQSRGQQVLLLVPEVYLLARWQISLAEFDPITYTADQPLPEQRRAWQAIRSGQAKLIIGTRAALFLSFFNLGGILVDYAENENYKQSDQNPRYDCLEVAGWLATLWHSSIAYLSPAPPLTLWNKTHHKSGAWRTLGDASSRARIEIIGLRVEREARQHGLVTTALQVLVARTLETAGKVFLYHNRRGTATAVLCRDCGFSPSCPTCQRPLVWAARENMLTCYHCDISQAIPLPCPSCGGANLQYRGAGLSQLEHEVHSLWPQISIVTIEGEGQNDRREEVAHAQLVLGSRAALSYLDFPTINLIAMVAPDAELALPELRTAEEAWARARFFLTSGAKRLVVQTYQPNHYVFQSLQREDAQFFYQAELAARTPYRYPPHGALLRLTTQAATKQNALAEARVVRTAVAAAIPQTCELIGPYPDYYVQVRGRYRFHLLLRYPNHGFNPTALWPLLPDGILIDRHPWHILS